MEISMVSQAAVRTTPDSLAGLLEGQSQAPTTAPLALTDASSAPAPSLESLLNVARAPVADGKANAKSKPKAKAKGAPGPQTEKTPAEKRELARTLFQIRTIMIMTYRFFWDGFCVHKLKLLSPITLAPRPAVEEGTHSMFH